MSSLPPDPYKILGVSQDAQLPEIRAAHRKLVLKCHPDKVQDPTLKAAKQDEFQKVQQAYELLSNENERSKYDDNVRLAELHKQMAKGMSANTSASRSPAARAYEVRTAEPRPSAFEATYRPSAGPKMYSAQYSSRSWEDQIHRPSPMFEEPRYRRASYDKPPSPEDEVRDRKREYRHTRKEEDVRDRETRERQERRMDRREIDRRETERREKERIAEKEREKRAAEKRADKEAKKRADDKEIRRQAKKAQEKADKEREKARRHAAEDKVRRHKPAYVEPFGDNDIYPVKIDKKKSSSTRKHEEKEKDKRSWSVPREDQPTAATAAAAAAAPAPAPAPTSAPTSALTADTKLKMTENILFAASYMDKSRQTGHPGSGRSETCPEGRFAPPTILPVPTPPAASPFPPPPPIPVSDDDTGGRRSKSRRSSEAKTRDKSSHKKSSPAKESQSPFVAEASPTSRPMPQFVSAHSSSPPKFSRAATFDSYSRAPPGIVRSHTYSVGVEPDQRGRHRSRAYPTVMEDSESDDDHYQRRSHRHRVHEPEHTRYIVKDGRTFPGPAGYVDPYQHLESPKRTYYNDVRPSMPSRESSYKVKTSNYYTGDDVKYADIPHTSFDRDGYAYA